MLAVTAPTEEQSKRAVALADEPAAGMTPDEIESAKAAAQDYTTP